MSVVDRGSDGISNAISGLKNTCASGWRACLKKTAVPKNFYGTFEKKVRNVILVLNRENRMKIGR